MQTDGNYRGIVAESYDLRFQSESFEDTAFYRHMMDALPGPALEIGCGTGRLLIPYLRNGLEVEGVDCSADMLDICRRKAEQQKLAPVLYEQYMQELDLPRKYKTIYIPFGSFMLVSGREEAMEALRLFYAHLDQEGQLLISTYLSWGEARFIPMGDIPAQQPRVWTLRWAKTRPDDGVTILVHEASISDYVEQLHKGWYRYEVYIDDRLAETYLQIMTLRWYFKYEFILMLEKVGFSDIFVHGDYTDTEVSDNHSVMIFRAKK